MTDDSCKPSRSAGSVPRACTPFSPPPPTSSVPVVAPPVFVPVAPVMPVMTVSGAAPDRFGNVDIRPFVSGKADKAPPAAAGNLASLDASGNLVDSLKSPSDFAPASHASDGSIHHTASEIGQIAAGEVAKVVANAPGDLDTLKEIADVIGTDTGQTASGILKRVADLETGKADKGEMSITPVAGSADRKTIQLKDGTSATVLTEHQDVSGKVDKDASKVAVGQNALATKSGTVAVGNAARATAVDAVQFGAGTNNTTMSLQFRRANLFVESGGMVRLGAGFPVATVAAPGSMSAADKAKLNGLSPQVQADYGQTNTTAPDFIKNKPMLAAVATSGSYDDLSGKPTIPAPVTVDATLATQGAAADAKAVGDALRGGFTEWEFSDVPQGYSVSHVGYIRVPQGMTWAVLFNETDDVAMADQFNARDAMRLTFTTSGGSFASMTATRHAFPPTKTSQLTNDGDGTNAFVKTNDARLADARTPTAHAHAVSDVTGLGAALAGKADRVANATNGNLAALDASGNLSDSGVKSSDFAAKADLPYALVTPGEWEFSGSPEGATDVGLSWDGMLWIYTYVIGTKTYVNPIIRPITEPPYDGNELSLTFSIGSLTITATRPSLPGHLLDRAVNAVSVTETTALILPNIIPSKARDFMIRLNVTGTQTVTFSAQSPETVTWLNGDPPTTFSAGTHLLSITESAPGEFVFVDAMLDGPESTANKVTSLSAQSTDVQYPSAKCVYDLVGNVESVLAAINGGVAS